MTSGCAPNQRPPPPGLPPWNMVPSCAEPISGTAQQVLFAINGLKDLCVHHLLQVPPGPVHSPGQSAPRGPRSADIREQNLLPQLHSVSPNRTSPRRLQVMQPSSPWQNGVRLGALSSPQEPLTASSRGPCDMLSPGRDGPQKSRSGTAVLRQARVQGQPSLSWHWRPKSSGAFPSFPNK